MEDKDGQVGSNCCMKSLQHKGKFGAKLHHEWVG